MQINLDGTRSDFQRLRKFLAAMVVNKSLFWSLHLKTNLERMRALGVAYWQESQKVKLTKRWASEKRKKGEPSEVDVATGQTKEQATFLTGSGVAYMNGRGTITTDILAAPWIPSAGRGSPRWKGYDSRRPFYYLNALRERSFWRPGDYTKVYAADTSIWNTTPPDEATLKEANKLLVMSPAQCSHLLAGKDMSLGSWKKGSMKGVASRWR